MLHLDLPQHHVVQVDNALVRQDIQEKLVQVAHLGITNQDLIAMVSFFKIYNIHINRHKMCAINFSACNCYSTGSSSSLCSSSAQCSCKTGYTGKTCSSCSSGYYKSGSYCYGEICLFIIMQL